MKKHRIIVPAIAFLLALIPATAILSQPAAPQAKAVRAPQKKPPAPAPLNNPQPQNFAPGLDDLMTMLIQPRHTKLYYAGTQKNWELATSELHDLRSGFDRAGQAIPNYLGNDVGKAVKTFMEPKLQEMDAALAAADTAKFETAYKNVTQGCNDCHVYMEHPFHVIKTPDKVPVYADQDFAPQDLK